jgi:hypothetical protein
MCFAEGEERAACATGASTRLLAPFLTGLAAGRRTNCSRRQEDNWQTAPPNDLTAFCWISVVSCTPHWSALSLTLAECPFLFYPPTSPLIGFDFNLVGLHEGGLREYGLRFSSDLVTSEYPTYLCLVV